MRSATSMALASCFLWTACGDDPGRAAAMQAFAEFQAALLQRSESRCRDVLTRESAAVLTEMPWDRVTRQQPLRVLGADRHQNTFRVRVTDPNAGDRASEFVVVREHGRLVVDLVATAQLHARPGGVAAGADTIEPAPLTPADHDRLRQWELAQPARE